MVVEWTWIYRNCRRFTMVFTGVLVPFWCHAIYNHHNGIAWAARFTHNGHHHCKKTSPAAIKKLAFCRPADTALFLTFVQLFDNWRVSMVVTDGMTSADLLSVGVAYQAHHGESCFRMMTSSNGNIFCVTGHLCGEFTGHRWIPLTKASDAELWCFLWLNGWVKNREAGD